MTLGQISALVFSLIFGVLSLVFGTLLVLGGVWGGVILWIPGALLLSLAVRMNKAHQPPPQ
jgi:hypothetical protein